MPLNEVHISSLVVHAKPQHIEYVKQQINQLPDCEIYGENEQGKLVVVMETTNQGYMTDSIDKIQQIKHVLSAALIFHQIENELDD